MKRKHFRTIIILSITVVLLLVSNFSHTVSARTITIPDDAPTLGDAIAMAGADDDIFIRAGIYRANTLVYKRVTIRGEVSPDGELLTVLDGSVNGSILHVVEDKCSIRDLILQNSAPFENCAAIQLQSHGNWVENTVIRKCGYGIFIQSTNENSIKNSVFFDNSLFDIKLAPFSDYNWIESNEFQCGKLGLYMLRCKRNTISRNLFSLESGMVLRATEKCDIYLNEFVCNFLNAEDDTDKNSWKANGWSDYVAFSGTHPIPGGGGAVDHNPHIALSLNHRQYNVRPDVYVPDDYPTISEAVNHEQGAIIYVRAGIYYEHNIDMEKNNVTVVGEITKEGQLLTVLDVGRNGCGFHFKASGLTLANFVVQNTDNDPDHDSGIFVYPKSCDNAVLNCVFRDNCIGINFHESDINSDMVMKDNRFYKYGDTGIQIRNGQKYEVIDNQFHMISKTGPAILLKENVNDAVIVNNMISTDTGIVIKDSKNNYVAENELTCDTTNAKDATGLNKWEYNGYSDFDYPFHIYEIHPGVTIDTNSHLAHSIVN